MSADSSPPPPDDALPAPPTAAEIARFYEPVTNPDAEFDSARDEYNLAEFPLSVLSEKTPPNLIERVIVSREGGKLTVTPSAKYGWPKSIDDDILLALVLLAKRRHFKDKRTYFTRQDILCILGLTDSGSNHRRVEKSIYIWSSLHLSSEGAWWSKGRRERITDMFHIIDRAWIHKPKREPKQAEDNDPICWVEWSDVFLDNCRQHNYRKFEFDQYLKLEMPIAKRLFRFLAKRFGTKQFVWEFDLHDLAFNHLGLLQTTSYLNNVNKLKTTLVPGFAELESTGFLKPKQEYFIRVRQGLWKVRIEAGPLFVFPKKSESLNPNPEPLPLFDAEISSSTEAPRIQTKPQLGPAPGIIAIGEIVETTGTVIASSPPSAASKPTAPPLSSPPTPKKAPNRPAERRSPTEPRESREDAPTPSARLLADRGVSPQVAARLAAEHGADRIAKQVEYFDFLKARDDSRVSRNGQGFLVSAVKEDFSAPAEWTDQRKKTAKRVEQAEDLRKEIEESIRRQRQAARQNALAAYVRGLSEEDKERLALLGGAMSPEDWKEFQASVPPMRIMWRTRLIDLFLAERLSDLKKWGFPAFEPPTV